ncbi:hypothetical protein J2X73_004492 [Novosphingobium sp. 1748]|nr:hypothetical protein [Novosphingobium sp. 1748]
MGAAFFVERAIGNLKPAALLALCGRAAGFMPH